MQAAKVFNQSFSCRGPLVLPVEILFGTSTEGEIDLSEALDRGVIDFISTVYIDMGGRSIDLDIVTNLVSQRVFAKRNTIGYYPLMVSSSPKFKLTASGLDSEPLKLIFSNIPYFPFIQTL
jgi:hypothetical protein